MKRIFLQLTAALSLCALAWAATRPRFGGSLSVEMRGSIASFDLRPSGLADDDFVRDAVASCVCDPMVTLDADGDPRPALSTSWHSERDNRSWHFTLRKGVTFHSGATLTSQMVVTPLATANPNWHVRAEGDAILIQSDTPIEDLLYELAEPRNSICLAGEDGHWIGSGPFQITEFRAGQFVELKAFDQSWQGRPFLDSLRFDMGKRLSDQALDTALSRVDLVQGEASETSARTQSQSTEPIELLALAFSPNRSSPADLRLRKAIALTIDRNSIFTVLLRRKGEAGAALLPEWISGYAHLVDASQNLLEAKRLFALANSRGALSVGYDATDPTAKLIAERLAVNAREAGVTMQPVAQTNRASTADATITRVRLESPNPAAALVNLGLLPHMTNLQKAQSQATAESLYGMENEALKDYTLVPIAHVPESFTASQRLHDFRMNRWGEVNWGNLWTEPPQ